VQLIEMVVLPQDLLPLRWSKQQALKSRQVEMCGFPVSTAMFDDSK
jgi:hypothetical protein